VVLPHNGWRSTYRSRSAIPFRLTYQALTEYVRKVDELSFAPLLRISSETDAGAESLWLDIVTRMLKFFVHGY
jgi:hypothetical protein